MTKGLWIVLALSLLVRIPLLLHPGCQCDVRTLAMWGWNASEGGLALAYERGADYPPVYVQMLGWMMSIARTFDQPAPNLKEDPAPLVVALVKMPPLLADLLLVVAVYAAARRWTTSRNAVLCAAAVGLNPALFYPTVLWGQIDSLPALFMVLTLALMLRRKQAAIEYFAAGGAWMVGLLTKAQSLVIAPVLAILLWRSGWRAWLQAAAGLLVVGALLVGPEVVRSGWSGVARHYIGAPERFPTITMQAYNGWYLATGSQGNWRGNPSDETSDQRLLAGPLTYRTVGLGLLGAWVLLVMVLQARRPEPSVAWVAAAALAIGFFVLPTQIHERYLYPAPVLLAPIMWADRRLALLFGTLSVAFLGNLVIVYAATPWLQAIADQLGTPVRLGIAAVNVGCLVASGLWLWKGKLIR